MDKKGTFHTIVEDPEAEARNSMDLPNLWHELEKSFKEIEYYKTLSSNTEKENHELQLLLKKIVEEKELEKAEKISQSLFTPTSSKINKEFDTSRSKFFEFDQEDQENKELKELKEKYQQLEHDNKELADEVIELRTELLQKHYDHVNTEIIDASIDFKDRTTNKANIFYENKSEYEITQRRNNDLTNKLEDIRNKEQELNYFYQKEMQKLVKSYKTLYEIYLKKRNFLIYKENQIITAYNLIQEKFEDINKKNNDFSLCFWIIIAVLILTMIFYYLKILKYN